MAFTGRIEFGQQITNYTANSNWFLRGNILNDFMNHEQSPLKWRSMMQNCVIFQWAWAATAIRRLLITIRPSSWFVFIDFKYSATRLNFQWISSFMIGIPVVSIAVHDGRRIISHCNQFRWDPWMKEINASQRTKMRTAEDRHRNTREKKMKKEKWKNPLWIYV